ncbi:hypothetical protein [Burkholderia gladioli]|uniref:hypothetical protein n=1 Tax=Burkholderia gladioli TaxID=28095 RepID=UPI003D21651A
MLDEHVAENSLADQVASQISRNGVDEWIRKKREARALIHPARERLDVDLPRMTRSLDTIISALSNAQRSYHEATLMGVPSLAGQVARANQPIRGLPTAHSTTPNRSRNCRPGVTIPWNSSRLSGRRTALPKP